jgi:YhgE/Pip-like protein
MSAIWRIFARDLRNLTRNVIGVIVLIGLIVVPALYAWFNIAASWNPYGNTKDLKVAVANEDRGYSSDLMPIRINVGETVVNKLRANDSLNWQFTDSAEARDGVASGQYYAAIIIPKQFSADMMTLFSSEVTHAKLEYVINEKIECHSSAHHRSGCRCPDHDHRPEFCENHRDGRLGYGVQPAEIRQKPGDAAVCKCRDGACGRFGGTAQ